MNISSNMTHEEVVEASKKWYLEHRTKEDNFVINMLYFIGEELRKENPSIDKTMGIADMLNYYINYAPYQLMEPMSEVASKQMVASVIVDMMHFAKRGELDWAYCVKNLPKATQFSVAAAQKEILPSFESRDQILENAIYFMVGDLHPLPRENCMRMVKNAEEMLEIIKDVPVV